MTMVSFCELSTCEGAMAHLFVSHGCFSQNARFFQPIVALQPKATLQWNELNFELVRNGMNSTLLPRTRDPAARLKMKKAGGERLLRQKWPLQTFSAFPVSCLLALLSCSSEKNISFLHSLFLSFDWSDPQWTWAGAVEFNRALNWIELHWHSLPAGCVRFLRWHTVHDARLRVLYDFSRMLLPCVFIVFFYCILAVLVIFFGSLFLFSWLFWL